MPPPLKQDWKRSKFASNNVVPHLDNPLNSMAPAASLPIDVSYRDTTQASPPTAGYSNHSSFFMLRRAQYYSIALPLHLSMDGSCKFQPDSTGLVIVSLHQSAAIRIHTESPPNQHNLTPQ